MSDNTKGRKSLERTYGKGCMFKKAHIEEQVEALRVIKTYKMFLRETRYTGKKIQQLEGNMTYHHLKHRSEGGKTNDENGSIINELAHRYMHSLPRDQEEIINDMIRNYKMSIGTLIPYQKGIDIKQPIQIDLDFDIGEDCITIPVYDNTKEDYEKRKKFNRAKVKRETRQFIEDELDFMEELEEER